MRYKHIETGNVYRVLERKIVDVTKGVDNNIMLNLVIYTDENHIYCRDEKKFFEKFKKVKETE